MRITVAFDKQCDLAGLPVPTPEYAFATAEKRRWRVDWCFIEQKVAIEVEGGIWLVGRHNRGPGFVRDMEKYNTLACKGFRLIRVTPREIDDGTALRWAERVLRAA